MPASFLGGPEFEAFRRRVLQIAEVLSIDLIEKRSGVFLGATQDTCFVILRRRASAIIRPEQTTAASGMLRHDGGFSQKGAAEIHADGAPWRLPGLLQYDSATLQHDSATLKDWGYRATVGYLVANRQPERLHKRTAKGRFPLIWAKAIASDGRLDFCRGASFKGWGWADAPEDAPYVVRDPCVAVQRTSARGQKRRLNAAAIPEAFIRKHGGIVAENHVILIVPIIAQAVPPQALAEALNRPAVSAELDRVCGSASISVRLLESIRLGKPPQTRR
jgi:adenine-specific DNA-methyltransferase